MSINYKLILEYPSCYVLLNFSQLIINNFKPIIKDYGSPIIININNITVHCNTQTQ